MKKGDMGLRSFMNAIIMLVISISACTVYTVEEVEYVNTDYLSPCWLNSNMIAYAEFEEIGMWKGITYTKRWQTRTYSIYTYNLSTEVEEEICRYQWSDKDSQIELQGVYSAHDTVFVDFGDDFYICSKSDSFVTYSINMQIGDNQFLKFSPDGDTIFYTDSVDLYRMNRNTGISEYLCSASTSYNYKVVDYFATPAGTLMVTSLNGNEEIYLLRDSLIQWTSFKGYGWYEYFGDMELRILSIGSPRTFTYYMKDNIPILEFIARENNSGNYGLCKINIANWDNDTVAFYNEIIGKRSPYTDKFMNKTDRSFYVIDSLGNVFIHR